MRLIVPVQLRWGDLDAFNHVNNVSLLKILEESRVRALWDTNVGSRTSIPTAVIRAARPDERTADVPGTLTLIARQEVEYLAPIHYRDSPLDIHLWFGAVGTSSFDLCYEVYDHRPIDIGLRATMAYDSAYTSELRTSLVSDGAVEDRVADAVVTVADASDPEHSSPIDSSPAVSNRGVARPAVASIAVPAPTVATGDVETGDVETGAVPNSAKSPYADSNAVESPPVRDTPYARGLTTIVLVDATTQRPRRVSDAERAAWQPFVAETLTFRRR